MHYTSVFSQRKRMNLTLPWYLQVIMSTDDFLCPWYGKALGLRHKSPPERSRAWSSLLCWFLWPLCCLFPLAWLSAVSRHVFLLWRGQCLGIYFKFIIILIRYLICFGSRSHDSYACSLLKKQKKKIAF